MRHANALKLLVALLLAALFPAPSGGRAPAALRQAEDCAQDCVQTVSTFSGPERAAQAEAACLPPRGSILARSERWTCVPILKSPRPAQPPERDIHPGPSPPGPAFSI